MTASTPLEQALAAWTRYNSPEENSVDQQIRCDDAVALGETRVFSNFAISLITGLDQTFVASLTGKTDKTGGRFNPEDLPTLLEIALEWRRDGFASAQRLGLVVGTTSPSMISKLTGVPRSTIYYKTRAES